MLLHRATRGHGSLTPLAALQGPGRVDEWMNTAGAFEPVRRRIRPLSSGMTQPYELLSGKAAIKR